jgi:hypothetical protein
MLSGGDTAAIGHIRALLPRSDLRDPARGHACPAPGPRLPCGRPAADETAAAATGGLRRRLGRALPADHAAVAAAPRRVHPVPLSSENDVGAGLRSYLGGASEATAFTTVVRDIPRRAAICAFGTKSAASLRISAQSSRVITPQSATVQFSSVADNGPDALRGSNLGYLAVGRGSFQLQAPSMKASPRRRRHDSPFEEAARMPGSQWRQASAAPS